jgi:acetyltransferase-like isoleucine patch superfamily enzyme
MKIGRNVCLGRIFVTWPHVVSIGKGCTIERGVTFRFDGPYVAGLHITVGESVFLGAGIEFNIKDQIIVGDHTLIASGCKFIDHDHGTSSDYRIDSQPGPCAGIEIGKDCWLGVNVVVLRGVRIGNGAVIGAGAVVNRNIPAGEIWAGVPARKIGTREFADAPLAEHPPLT